jgi:hypothetical protein
MIPSSWLRYCDSFGGRLGGDCCLFARQCLREIGAGNRFYVTAVNKVSAEITRHNTFRCSWQIENISTGPRPPPTSLPPLLHVIPTAQVPFGERCSCTEVTSFRALPYIFRCHPLSSPRQSCTCENCLPTLIVNSDAETGGVVRDLTNLVVTMILRSKIVSCGLDYKAMPAAARARSACQVVNFVYDSHMQLSVEY